MSKPMLTARPLCGVLIVVLGSFADIECASRLMAQEAAQSPQAEWFQSDTTPRQPAEPVTNAAAETTSAPVRWSTVNRASHMSESEATGNWSDPAPIESFNSGETSDGFNRKAAEPAELPRDSKVFQTAGRIQSPEADPRPTPTPFDDQPIPPPTFAPDHETYHPPSPFMDEYETELVPPEFSDEQFETIPQTTPCPDCHSSGSYPRPVEPKPLVVPYQTRLTGTWLAGEGDDLGMTDFDLSSVLVFPNTVGLAVTPGFQMHLLDGPSRTDLPGTLYNARLEVALKRPWDQRWSYFLSIAPGIYSDFETSDDSLRIISRALVFYKYSPTTEFTAGLLYVDRENISVLPAAGVIYTPNPNTRVELLFPKPKLATKLFQGNGREWWGYLAGEFGGGSWAIQRANGADDVVTYSDWRLLLGMEVKYPGHKTVFQNVPKVFVELGYVFNRELEYKSDRGDYDPDDTALLRAGFVY